jgi:hypothetical protein
MGEFNTEVDVTAQPVAGRAEVATPPLADTSARQPTASPTPAPQPKESAEHSEEPATQPNAPVDKPFFQDFKAGEEDPLVGVKIKEVLKKTDNFIVYIDEELSLRWHWSKEVDSNSAAPIFNRACELQAKSEFLGQAFRKRDLKSARRLIGEGLVVMFCTKNPTHANEALDTAEKFIDQTGRETSRGWYFGPFFIFFSLSVASGLVLFFKGQVQNTTLPLVCCLAGGIGAFISTAIGNQRIPCAPSAGWILHLLEALLRYTIGFAAGLLVWLATTGNIGIGFLYHTGNDQAASIYALIAVALLSGTSERFLPSLIAKFDDSTKETTGAQTTKTETPKPNPTTTSS